MDSSNTLTTLYSFPTEGLYPQASLIQAPDGVFYGTTSAGGASGAGTVFKTDATGNVTTLHSFDNADGAAPHGALIRATDGNFYGTTQRFGGAATSAPCSRWIPRATSRRCIASIGTDGASHRRRSSRPPTASSTARLGRRHSGSGTVFKMDSSGT